MRNAIKIIAGLLFWPLGAWWLVTAAHWTGGRRVLVTIVAGIAGLSLLIAITPSSSSRSASRATPLPAVAAVNALAGAPLVAEVAPTAVPVPTADTAWAAFVVYGPKLADYLNRSDEINRLVAAAAAVTTAASLPRLYTAADQAAAATGRLKSAALSERVPDEAHDFRQAVYQALADRETAFKQLKGALDKPGVRATAEYQQARSQVERATLGVVGKLFALCDKLGATPDECTQAVGWGG